MGLRLTRAKERGVKWKTWFSEYWLVVLRERGLCVIGRRLFTYLGCDDEGTEVDRSFHGEGHCGWGVFGGHVKVGFSVDGFMTVAYGKKGDNLTMRWFLREPRVLRDSELEAAASLFMAGRVDLGQVYQAAFNGTTPHLFTNSYRFNIGNGYH